MIPTNGTLQKIKYLLAILALAFILAGCRLNAEKAQPVQTQFLPLVDGQVVGQTFVSHYDGLGAVGVLINPEAATDGILKFALYSEPNQDTPLRQVELSTAEITYPDYSYFYFPPIPGSNQQDYYFTLEWNGSQSVSAGVSDGNSYQDGALYVAQQAQDKQLSFELIYGRRLMLIGLAQEMFYWLGILIIAGFLFCIPGWALLCYFYPVWDSQGFWVKIALAAGVSIAIYPIIILWTDLIGLHLGAVYAWLPPLAGSAAILIRNRKKITLEHLKSLRFHLPEWSSVAMVLTVGLVTVVRFWVIRSLSVPLWGDSYQHSVIAQLIVENGGLFQSWLPYAELQSFTYHFGFHSLVAIFHWITRLPITQSVLWTGQIVNILAVISLYPLARRLNRNPWSGVFAVALAGFAFPMPMFYLNWGRYTQLTGLTLLASWTYLAWDYFDNKSIVWRTALLSSVLLAGLALTHYRILIFALIFIVTYFLMNFQLKRLGLYLKLTLAMGFPALLLALPWYVNTFSGKLWLFFSHQITTPALQHPESFREANAIGDIFFFLPTWAWLVLPILIALALWKNHKAVALISLWWYFIFLAANPQWLKLPGIGVLSSFAVMISLYFPVSLIIGSSVGWLVDSITVAAARESPPPGKALVSLKAGLPALLSILVVAGCLYSLPLRVKDINIAQNSLAAQPDLRAARWIQKNLPGDAEFLVNSFFAYSNTAVVGSDGGWWLPIIANRRTNLPPLPYTSEKGTWSEYRAWVNSLVTEIQEKGIDNPDVLQELKHRNIEYIYIGQKQGQVNSPGALLQLDTLLANPIFEPIYHQDRVWIFRIKDQLG